MYQKLCIKNFRCFPEISLGDLQRINLIAGDNNTGKSALLEALWLLGTPNQPELANRLSTIRGQAGLDPEDLLSDLFHRFDASEPVSISAVGTWGGIGQRHLEVIRRERSTFTIVVDNQQSEPHVADQGQFTAHSPHEIAFDYTDEYEVFHSSYGHWVKSDAKFTELGGSLDGQLIREGMLCHRADTVNLPASVYLSPSRSRTLTKQDANLYSRLDVKGEGDIVLNTLRQIDKRVRDITVAVIREPMLHIDIGIGTMVSAALLGDGVSRFLSMVLRFQVARGGVLLRALTKSRWGGFATSAEVA